MRGPIRGSWGGAVPGRDVDLALIKPVTPLSDLRSPQPKSLTSFPERPTVPFTGSAAHDLHRLPQSKRLNRGGT